MSSNLSSKAKTELSQSVRCRQTDHGGFAGLGGVTVDLKVGDTIGLQYKNVKARYRVQWVGTPSGKERQIGVVSMQPEKDLWGVQMPASEPDAFDAPRTRPKRVYEKRADE